MNEPMVGSNDPGLPQEENLNAQQQSPMAPVEQERTFKQADIDRLIKAAKAEAHEKGKRDALTEMQRSQPVSQPMASTSGQLPAPVQTPSQPQSLGGINQASNEDIDRRIQEGIQRVQQQMAAQHFGQQFEAKVYAPGSREKYPDYDTKVNALNLTHPDVLPLLPAINAMENVPDLLHDFHTNMPKFTNLVQMAKINPDAAFKEMQNWSHSIKLNQNAANAQTAPEPLTNLSSSNAGTGSGSPGTTVDAFRKASWAKV